MPNYRELELDFFERTGIYSIMHTLPIRRDVYGESRWIARNLMTAFEEAKAKMVERLSDFNVARIPMPWMQDRLRSGKTAIFPGE
ncbi:MAG: hypothetical protein HN884_13025 [Rhodospirillaceae bacterium]|jgi:4,5-dihydroxyphthalate decarboxylase|nr:hypothetical protein [Rhodospirillaceae bacterium]MBT7267793.1 hypothetical protein [Rhodospirillaceae bacterium]